MGDLFLVLLLVVVICGSIPLLASAYMRGDLKIPRWLLTVFAFVGISIVAILRFPLTPSFGNPASYLIALGVYVYVGRFLRKAYTRSKWRFCMVFTFLANCVGILIQSLIFKIGMVYDKSNFNLTDALVFLIVVEAVVFFAYFFTSDNDLKKANQAKGRKK